VQSYFKGLARKKSSCQDFALEPASHCTKGNENSFSFPHFTIGTSTKER